MRKLKLTSKIQSKTVWYKKKYNNSHIYLHKYCFKIYLSFLSQETPYYFKYMLTIQSTWMYAETFAKWPEANNSLPLQFSCPKICFCSPLEQNQTVLYSTKPELSKLLFLDQTKPYYLRTKNFYKFKCLFE